MAWACSMVPPFSRYAVIPVARKVWQPMGALMPGGLGPPADHAPGGGLAHGSLRDERNFRKFLG